MGIPITQVDAFTDRPFAGNPAAVCILPAPRDAAWMPGYFGHTRFDALVELASERVLRDLKPNLAELAKLPGRG